MAFIKIEKVISRKYRLKFVGQKTELSSFVGIIVYDPLVHFNFLTKQWELYQEDLQSFLNTYNYLDIPVEHKLPKIKMYDKELDGIGLSMKLRPYIYQREAIKFVLDNNNALLILPCGAGKTPSGIGMFIEATERGMISGKGLIVVKASLKTQWVNEIGKFSNLKAVAIESPSKISAYTKTKINKNKKQIKTLDKIKDNVLIKELKAKNKELEEKVLSKFKEQFEGRDLFVVNYEALLDDTIRQELQSMELDFIFADEIHMIGSKESKRSKALQEFEAKIKVGATATPITKNPENLYSIFKFIKPDLFPSWSKFSSEFIKWAGRGRISGVRNGAKLTKTIAPYIMIKSKEEISDQLPELQVMQRYITLTEEQYEMNSIIMSQLDELKEQDFQIRSRCKTEFEAKMNPELQKVGAQILALQTFAQEIANEPRLLVESDSEFAKKFAISTKLNPKMDMFMDLVEEIIESGEKLAVFSKFERMQQIITERIHKYDKSIKIAYVNGGLSSAERSVEVYDKFRDNPDYKVLLLSDAGAEGLNLSKCQYLIEYDIAGSYAIQTQRHGRLERADSVHDNVFVYQLIATESWDTIQQKIVEKKENYDLELIKSIAN